MLHVLVFIERENQSIKTGYASRVRIVFLIGWWNQLKFVPFSLVACHLPKLKNQLPESLKIQSRTATHIFHQFRKLLLGEGLECLPEPEHILMLRMIFSLVLCVLFPFFERNARFSIENHLELVRREDGKDIFGNISQQLRSDGMDVDVFFPLEHMPDSTFSKKIQKRYVKLFVSIVDLFVGSTFEQLLTSLFWLICEIKIKLFFINNRLSHVLETSVELSDRVVTCWS